MVRNDNIGVNRDNDLKKTLRMRTIVVVLQPYDLSYFHENVASAPAGSV